MQQFASELLSVILQQSEKARARLTEKIDGVDLLLRVTDDLCSIVAEGDLCPLVAEEDLCPIVTC